MVFYKYIDDDLNVYNKFKEYGKKITFKVVQVMKFTSKNQI